MAAKRVSACLLLALLCALPRAWGKSVLEQGAVGELGMGVVVCLGEASWIRRLRPFTPVAEGRYVMTCVALRV